jgi:integrase
VHATFRSALTAAVKAGEVSRNAATLADLPRAARHKVRPWEPEQLGAFLDATADERLAPLFHLCAFASLRLGEACGLKWSAVDLERARLTVDSQRTTAGHQVVEGATKTAESENVVDLDAGTVEVLRPWRRIQVTERLA